MEFEKRAIRDAQSGLFNLRYFSERFDEEMDRSQRYSLPLSIAYFHIPTQVDPLDESDDLLRNVANRITEASRNVDLCARCATRDFVVLLTQTDMDGARAYAENLLQLAKEGERPLTVYACVASFQSTGTSSCQHSLEILSETIKKASDDKPIIQVLDDRNSAEHFPFSEA